MADPTVNKQKEKFFLSKVTDGTLSISRTGVVYNNKTERFIAETPDSSGYCAVSMYNPELGKVQTIGVHRLVYLLYKGEIPFGIEVNHEDGLQFNNDADNLEPVTSSENNLHALDLGLNPAQGETHHNSYFTHEEVRSYRAKYSGKISKRETEEIALKHGVSAAAVSQMIKGITYKRV